MSPRIQELAEQAELNATLLFNKEKLEKFAQLIIQECMNKIENEAAQYHEPVWAVELVNDIKEHFGIES